jgi:hypothetical protein
MLCYIIIERPNERQLGNVSYSARDTDRVARTGIKFDPLANSANIAWRFVREDKWECQHS